jgi:hypothetical protein
MARRYGIGGNLRSARRGAIIRLCKRATDIDPLMLAMGADGSCADELALPHGNGGTMGCTPRNSFALDGRLAEAMRRKREC